MPLFNYPLIAIGDLHGQRGELERLIAKLEKRPEWNASALVFLGDFVDRGPDVRGLIDLVFTLLKRPAGGTAVMGNHDLALVRAAGLDGDPPSPYWIESYANRYDHHATFESYHVYPFKHRFDDWTVSLAALREAMPEAHKGFLAALPWLAEAPGHLFIHCGLSPELEATADEQVEALRAKRWDRATLRPLSGTYTSKLWQDDYPVWLGADRGLSARPLPHPSKVQVTGHDRVAAPDAGSTRIRIDTGGGFGPLTACLLESPGAAPVFVSSR